MSNSIGAPQAVNTVPRGCGDANRSYDEFSLVPYGLSASLIPIVLITEFRS